jgi:hypothetical protein
MLVDTDQLRALLARCSEVDDKETKARVEAALRVEDPFASVRPITHETLAWLRNMAAELSIDLNNAVATPVWILPSPLVNAFVTRRNGQDDIIVYEGTLQVLAFLIWFWVSSTKLSTQIEKASMQEQDRIDIKNHRDLCLLLAPPLIMSCLRAPTPLPNLSTLLQAEDERTAKIHLICAECFMLLHEEAHVRLGHTAGGGSAPLLQEFKLIVDETLKDCQVEELEADAHALRSVAKNVRGHIAMGAIWFLLIVAYHEAFLMRVSTAHPLALNRMQAILDSRCMDEAQSRLTQVLIEGMSNTQISGQRFSHIPIHEKLNFFFGGRKPAFAADFIEWWLYFATKHLSRPST